MTMSPLVRFGFWALALVLVSGCGSSPVIDRSLVDADESTQLIEAAAEGNKRTVERKVEGGNAINARGPEGTALYQAVINGHEEIVWYLLKQGAEADRGVADGTTPLMAAASLGEDRMVRMLLAAGADVEQRDASGDSALAYAALNSQLVVTNRLLRAGAEVDVVNEQGQSLLIRVVERNDLLLGGVLLDAGADVKHEDADGRTAIDVARANNNRDLELMIANAEKNRED